MATTVISAFNEFLKEKVNLDPEDTKAARLDRDNLRTRIQGLQNSVDYFPTLYTEADINYGSFSRRTKKRPLDDVDMFFCLMAQGAVYNDYDQNNITVTIENTASNLYQYTKDDNKTISSIKILNKFKRSLENIYQYRNAEVNRRQEVVLLDLTNKDWSFDIAPCFRTVEQYGKSFYLIPNGTGDWKKADPRIDKNRTITINQQNNGNILNLIRIIKYWNNRSTMHTMSSYLLENIILNYYQYRTDCSSFVDLSLADIFHHISLAVYQVVPDPKGFQGDLNNLTYEQRVSISTRAHQDYLKALEARRLEQNKDEQSSINKWREIFGLEFPAYG
ncbi:TPA: nucleotidyltransferase [Pseudomonas aeruginosa]|nr:nucleotidyltransferase [Pseudomonas aeruginosa]HBO9145466.1 nucleotidyltransferase [Pseudomonas aeruginosa]HBO9246469.1 nucleotidyltransferase [Pseudomonas aeruginosa]HBO9313189.1 nucleotidyltransferase [Pseudomonas aeruginosa]HBO9743153.1 nucleotidyltransferase [Pseudomonas aeruginosa]